MVAKAGNSSEVITLLRQAWKHAEAANSALIQARKHAFTRDLIEAFLAQAADHTHKSKEKIEAAGNLLASLKEQIETLQRQL